MLMGSSSSGVSVCWHCQLTPSHHAPQTQQPECSSCQVSTAPALRVTLQARCHHQAGHLLLQHLTSLFLPSWEHWLYQYICVLLAGSTGCPSLGVLWAPWSASQWEAQGFITL